MGNDYQVQVDVGLSLKMFQKMNSRFIMGLILVTILMLRIEAVSDINVAPGSGYLCISDCLTCPLIICSPPPSQLPHPPPTLVSPQPSMPLPLLSPPPSAQLPPLPLSPPPPISLPTPPPPPPPQVNKFYYPPPISTDLTPPMNYVFGAPPPPQKPSSPAPPPHPTKSPLQPQPTPPTKGEGSTSTKPPLINYFYTSKAAYSHTHPTACSFFLQAALLLLAVLFSQNFASMACQ